MRGGKRLGAGRKTGYIQPDSELKKRLKIKAQMLGDKALDFLEKVIADDDAPYTSRVQAAIHILDRAIGKPLPSEPDAPTGEAADKPKGLTPEAAQSIRSDILGVPNE